MQARPAPIRKAGIWIRHASTAQGRHFRPAESRIELDQLQAAAVNSTVMQITRTTRGFRMAQHGVVISELRTTPGPTHSVFDVLAALVAVLQPAGPTGVLGFGGGGMLAPLQALGVTDPLQAVDLDRTGWDLFRKHCPAWVPHVSWHQADAVEWLRDQPAHFALLIEDISIPDQGDVFKPSFTWDILPSLIHDRLVPGGTAIFNLLPPPNGIWRCDISRIAATFGGGCSIRFDEFENVILVAGRPLPLTRELGTQLRTALRSIRSRLADRIHLRTEHGTA
jgi:hypothetical protein